LNIDDQTEKPPKKPKEDEKEEKKITSADIIKVLQALGSKPTKAEVDLMIWVRTKLIYHCVL